MTDALERLRAQIPQAQDGGQDGILSACLLDAQQYILAYTCRDALPPELESARVRLALILYNRQGMEGEQARTEGGVTRHIGGDDLPASIRDQLTPWRLTIGAARARGEQA